MCPPKKQIPIKSSKQSTLDFSKKTIFNEMGIKDISDPTYEMGRSVSTIGFKIVEVPKDYKKGRKYGSDVDQKKLLYSHKESSKFISISNDTEPESRYDGFKKCKQIGKRFNECGQYVNPRIHSEIGAFQYITGSSDPCNGIGKESLLQKALNMASKSRKNKDSKLRAQFYVKNTPWAPCNTEYGEKTINGIIETQEGSSCDRYLEDFAKNNNIKLNNNIVLNFRIKVRNIENDKDTKYGY